MYSRATMGEMDDLSKSLPPFYAFENEPLVAEALSGISYGQRAVDLFMPSHKFGHFINQLNAMFQPKPLDDGSGQVRREINRDNYASGMHPKRLYPPQLFKLFRLRGGEEYRFGRLLALYLRVGLWFLHMIVSNSLWADPGLEHESFKEAIKIVGQAIDAWHGRGPWPLEMHPFTPQPIQHPHPHPAAYSLAKPIANRRRRANNWSCSSDTDNE